MMEEWNVVCMDPYGERDSIPVMAASICVDSVGTLVLKNDLGSPITAFSAGSWISIYKQEKKCVT